MGKLISSMRKLIARGGKLRRTVQLGLALAVLSTVTAQAVSPNGSLTSAIGAESAGYTTTSTDKVPRFNFQPEDRELLRGANLTENQSTWADPVNAKVGDKVAVILYFHNGVVDSVAHNTSFRVDIPTNETSQIVANGHIWSTETAAISDTLTINLPSNGRAQYVSGSTKLYDYQGNFVRVLPDGITNSGINIGDVKGCWQYSGTVTFVLDIFGRTDVNISKFVAHLSDEGWSNDIIAQPGETVAFKIGLENKGNITAPEVIVKDSMPQNLSYVPGSTKVWNTSAPDGLAVPDGLFDPAGLPIPNLKPGNEGITFITYKAKLAADFPGGWWTLNNLAVAFIGTVEQGRAQATVRVFGAKPGLTVSKAVYDGTSWVEQINAKLNDVVTYRIIVANTGNTDLYNVSVRDVLPEYARYLSGSTRIEGSAGADIWPAGLNLGTFKPQDSKIITFQVKMDGCIPLGGYTLINTAYAKADGLTEIHDTAKVVVNVSAPIDLPISDIK